MKKEIYSTLFFLINDVFSLLGRSYLKKGVFSFSQNVLYMILKDLTIFSDKKTNLGLFHLKNDLSLRLFISGGDVNSSMVLLKNLKIKRFN